MCLASSVARRTARKPCCCAGGAEWARCKGVGGDLRGVIRWGDTANCAGFCKESTIANNVKLNFQYPCS